MGKEKKEEGGKGERGCGFRTPINPTSLQRFSLNFGLCHNHQNVNKDILKTDTYNEFRRWRKSIVLSWSSDV